MHPKLITIAPSHFCEKSRWSLQLAKIDYIEEAHTPFFHASAVKKSGGVRSTPILKLENKTIPNSVAITKWISNNSNSQWNPYATKQYQSDIQKLELELGRKLGVLTRLLAYHELLPYKDQVMTCMTSAPASEQKWFSRGFFIFGWLMRKGMNINTTSAQSAFTTVQAIFETVEKEAHGEFLIGDRLSIADITFASLAAPVILPESYGASLPPFEDLSSKAQQMMRSFRSMPAGQRVLRLYKEFRYI